MTKKQKTPQRWSIGLFRTKAGSFITVYCDKAGTPAPYLRKKIKGATLVICGIYKNMSYSQARARLLRDAKKAGKLAAKKSAKEEHIVKKAA